MEQNEKEQNEKLKKILNMVRKEITESEKYLKQFEQELSMDEKDILRMDDTECNASYELGYRDALREIERTLTKEV